MNDVSAPPPVLWKSSGRHLVTRAANGWLEVTPELLRAYYTRPEIHPVEESCASEHRLFEALMDDPLRAVAESELDGIADRDTAENYRVVLRFRDHLASAGTIEQAYLDLFTRAEPLLIPPVFIEQMAHLVLAGMLEGETDAFVARAAELFFRDQKVTTGDGQIMFADAEVIEMRSRNGGFGVLSALLSEAGATVREATLDVLSEDNAAQYRARSDRFDFALDFRFNQRGPGAFGEVVAKWVRHFLGVEVRVEAMQSIHDEQWTWHVGLDAESTKILNALYTGGELPDGGGDRLAALFRMEFDDPNVLVEAIRGKAVYLGLAMNGDNIVRMKPQNLLVNLPLRQDN